jgi:hypothetical protein
LRVVSTDGVVASQSVVIRNSLDRRMRALRESRNSLRGVHLARLCRTNNVREKIA